MTMFSVLKHSNLRILGFRGCTDAFAYIQCLRANDVNLQSF